MGTAARLVACDLEKLLSATAYSLVVYLMGHTGRIFLHSCLPLAVLNNPRLP